MSNEVFDGGSFTDRDIDVFIDIMEKLFGAKPDSMSFIRQLIDSSVQR